MFSRFRTKPEAGKYLVVGLGNPGAKYAGTRHNIGAAAAERFAQRNSLPGFRSKFKAYFCEGRVSNASLALLLPQTFMNLSGDSVAAAARKLGVSPDRIVVLYDDLDIDFGRLKLKRGGGPAGHNGIRSMIERLGSKDFLRVRMGIGRPAGDPVGYVLGKFPPDEKAEVPDFIEDAAEAVEMILSDGFDRAANRFNTRK